MGFLKIMKGINIENFAGVLVGILLLVALLFYLAGIDNISGLPWCSR